MLTINLLSATTFRSPRQVVKKSSRIDFDDIQPLRHTSCHLPYILLGKTLRKVTGYGREEGKYPQSIGADKSCSKGNFQHSPSAHRR